MNELTFDVLLKPDKKTFSSSGVYSKTDDVFIEKIKLPYQSRIAGMMYYYK